MYNEVKFTNNMDNKGDLGEFQNKSQNEEDILKKLKKTLLNNLSSTSESKLEELILTSITRQSLSRIIFFNEIYKRILNIPGVICEFGVNWGNGVTLLSNYRSMYEPYNHSRKIIGFDTFTGFPEVTNEDGSFSKVGDYRTNDNYEKNLEEILRLHELNAPLNHIKKFEMVKGDINKTLEVWLKNNPHAIISMAIIDVDLYKPSATILEKIIPRLTKGSLIVFDELNHPEFPGETQALIEKIGINNLSLRTLPFTTYPSYAIWE